MPSRSVTNVTRKQMISERERGILLEREEKIGEMMKTLSEDQAIVITRVKEGKSIFFTGAAGSGKSFILKYVG